MLRYDPFPPPPVLLKSLCITKEDRFKGTTVDSHCNETLEMASTSTLEAALDIAPVLVGEWPVTHCNDLEPSEQRCTQRPATSYIKARFEHRGVASPCTQRSSADG